MNAVKFLIEVLGSEPKTAKEIKKLGLASGFNSSILHRAKKRLGVKTKKNGMDSGWVWSLDDSSVNKYLEEERASHSSAERKTRSRAPKFSLPDIQRTICIFIEKNNGAEMLINSEYHDDVIYSDPEKYIFIMSALKKRVEDEIKKAQDILDCQ